MGRFWIKNGKVIIITICMGFMGILVGYFIYGGSEFSFDNAAFSWFQAAFLFFILWRGNVLVGNKLDKFYPWLHYPIKRFTYGIIGAVVFTSSVLLVVGIAINVLFDITFGSDQMLPLYFANGIAVFIFCFMVAWQFLLSWQKLALREEKMKNEVLSARYESLKNQVNPHFLFNSLNSLSSLINEDSELADRFVKQLSIVYRYVLETRTKEAVTVAEELAVLESFIFLEKIRFGENLRIEINIREEDKSKLILPLVLQMLLENAIKHNAISKDDPLCIHLYKEDNFMVVENNLQPKSILRNQSVKVGLENIKSRYKIFSDEDLVIEKTKRSFIVKIPLLAYREK
jgi:sensor histidine kinase YesM